MFLNSWNSFFSEMCFLSGNNNKPKAFLEYAEHPKSQLRLFLPSAESGGMSRPHQPQGQ